MANVHCIFDNDLDGFTAAWAVWRHFEKVKFHEGVRNQPLPDIHDALVYVVDFCGSYDQMVTLVENNIQVVVIDHHKTQSDTLIQLANEFPSTRFVAVYDVDHSAAWLAWTHFNGVTRVPALVELVEDRDIWTWRYKDTRYFNDGLEYLSRDRRSFELWEMTADPDNHERIIEAGKIECQNLMMTCQKTLDETGRLVEFEGQPAVLVKGDGRINSDLSHMAMDQFDVGLALCYKFDEDICHLRLTSKNDSNIDVGDIAQRYGGGGHQHAAGCRIDKNHPVLSEEAI